MTLPRCFLSDALSRDAMRLKLLWVILEVVSQCTWTGIKLVEWNEASGNLVEKTRMLGEFVIDIIFKGIKA